MVKGHIPADGNRAARQRVASTGIVRGKTGSARVAERPEVPRRSGNSGGGKGPQFKGDVERSKGQEIDMNPKTPERVQKLQTALHTKAKESPGYRFYALYDKIY